MTPSPSRWSTTAGCGEAGVGPAQLLGHPVVQLGQTADVGLVDDRAGPRRPRPVGGRVGSRQVAGVDDDRVRDVTGGVARVRGTVRVAGQVGADEVAVRLGRVRDVAVEPAGVRVDQQLGGVVAVPGGGLPRPVRAEAVPLAGADTGDGGAEDARALWRGERDAGLVGSVEQAQVDTRRVGGVDRDVHARVGDMDTEAWRSPAGGGRGHPDIVGGRSPHVSGVSAPGPCAHRIRGGR